jgi:hypothetical protein
LQGQPTVKVELLRDLEYILSAFVKRVRPKSSHALSTKGLLLMGP